MKPQLPSGNHEKEKRKRNVQSRTIETKRKIIAAAEAEFAQMGFNGASVRTIAKRADLQHTLITYHFGNKEGLWQATVSRMLSEYTKQQESRLHGLRGVEAATTLRLIDEDFIRFSARKLNFHKIMSHVASSSSPQLDWLVEKYLRQTFNDRAALGRMAQSQKKYVQGDPYHLQYIFIGAVTRFFMLESEVGQILGKSPRDPELLDEHIRLCLSLFFRE